MYVVPYLTPEKVIGLECDNKSSESSTVKLLGGGGMPETDDPIPLYFPSGGVVSCAGAVTVLAF